MAIQSDDERARTVKRSKAASAALKGKLRQSPGPRKIERPPVPRTYTPADLTERDPIDHAAMDLDADERDVPHGEAPTKTLRGVELFKQHFARQRRPDQGVPFAGFQAQELGLPDGRGNVHTDELMLPRGWGEDTPLGLPTRRSPVGTKPGENGGNVGRFPGPRKPATPSTKPPVKAGAPRAQPAAPAGGRPRMVQMGEEGEQLPQAPRPNAPRQAAPQGARPDMSVQARIARKNQIQQQITQRKIDELVRNGFRPEDAAQMVNPEEINEQAHRALVHDEVESGIQAARAEHDAMQQAARSAPRQPTQEESDDARMAREWRDLQTRGKGVHAANEREANETSNAGALAAMDAREAADKARFDERVARSVAFDKQQKAKRDAERAAAQAANPEQFARDEAARKERLKAGLKARQDATSVNQMRRRYGDAYLAQHGWGPARRAQAIAQGPQSIGAMRSDLFNGAEGNAAQQLAARNAQRARQRAFMEGRGNQILADSLIAAGDDPARQGAAFADAGFPVLAQNIAVNNMAARAAQPPAPPDMKAELDAIYGPNGLINHITANYHPAHREGALRTVLSSQGASPEMVEQAVSAMRGPQPTFLERLNRFFHGAPVEPPAQPPAQPAPNQVGAATGYLDPRSVARGMQGPRMLRGLV